MGPRADFHAWIISQHQPDLALQPIERDLIVGNRLDQNGVARGLDEIFDVSRRGQVQSILHRSDQ